MPEPVLTIIAHNATHHPQTWNIGYGESRIVQDVSVPGQKTHACLPQKLPEDGDMLVVTVTVVGASQPVEYGLVLIYNESTRQFTSTMPTPGFLVSDVWSDGSLNVTLVCSS